MFAARTTAFAFFAAVSLVAAASAKAGESTKKLEIHVFDVGQGNSQLIVFPSGYKIFVDVPEYSWNGNSGSTLVAGKLEKILGSNKTIDVGVITHLHRDHVGYAEHGGMWALIEKFGYTFERLIDRDHGVWRDANGDGECTESEIEWHNIGEMSTLAAEWVCYATDPSTTAGKHRVVPKIGSTTQIAPPDSGAVVTIVSADAKGAVMKDGTTPVSGDNRNASCPPNENDYSIGFVLQFGAFRYGTFGDLDGMWVAGYNTCYNQIETTVGPRIGKELDVATVNHHGSFRSSSDEWIKATNPVVSIISCGLNNTFSLPSQQAVNKYLALGGDLYVTERGNPSVKFGNATITNADVLISVAGPSGTEYEVIVNGTAKKHKSKNQ